MNTITRDFTHSVHHPVDVRVQPAIEDRNRLTVGFRIFLAIPHLLLVGGPLAAGLSWSIGKEGNLQWTAGGGVFGVVAAVAALIAWFAIVFTAKHPKGLWDLAAFYLRWRVRAVAYTALLRDEYPPFDERIYPAELELMSPDLPRNRLTVAFRIILAIPQLIVVWALSLVWAFITVIAWFAILFTGRYPHSLYDFAIGVFRWNVRVEAYLLLLTDEYPPFALH